MKKHTKTAIAAMALMLIPAVASAETTPHELCTDLSGLAGTIMMARQVGMPMSEVMDIVAKDGGEGRGLAEALVIDAYSQPRYSTGEFQQQAIGDFADSNYLTCITELR